MTGNNVVLEYLLEENIHLRNARGPTGFGWEYPNESVFIIKTIPNICPRFFPNGIRYDKLAAALHVFYGIFVDYSWRYSKQHGLLPMSHDEKNELRRMLAGTGAGLF